MEIEDPVEIRVIDAVCYTDCPEQDGMFFLSFVTKFDWTRWKFIEIPKGVEQILHVTISISNKLEEPIFINDCGGEIRRESIAGPKASHRLFAGGIPISDRLSGKPISFDPWIRLDAGEKLIWDLKFDLSLLEPFQGRDSYIESVLFGLTTDQGVVLREIKLAKKEGKNVQWRCLQYLAENEKGQEPVPDAGLPAKPVLYENLQHAFSLDELRILCFELGVDHENFSSRKESIAREIVEYFERAGRTEELVVYCERKRPAIQWRAGIEPND